MEFKKSLGSPTSGNPSGITMASDSPPILRARIPLYTPGGPLPNETSGDPTAPIHIVRHASQLPCEFLNPSADSQLIIGLDCEGIDLCQHGALCVIQLAFPDAIYLVDAIEGGEVLVRACKAALESSYITKVIHDCKRDSEALYFQYGIKLHNVVDTQIAYSLIEEQEGRKRAPDDFISFVSLLADPHYCGVTYLEKEEIRVLLRKDPNFWTYRPMSEKMIRTAADDVCFLLYIYQKMMEKLNKRSLWHLAVRGCLYCRCFCISDNTYADWPPLPPLPDSLVAEGYNPPEEILSVLDVPPGKMGLVIGKKGVSILSIKESCNAEILIGGAKGPPNKEAIWSHGGTSKKLVVVARSSAEAEYRAMTHSTYEIMWIKTLLEEFGFPIIKPMTLYCDNLAGTYIATNHVFHEGTKHIEVDCHFIRDAVLFKKIDTHVSSSEQVADIFTKILGPLPFSQLFDKLKLTNIYILQLEGEC